MNSRRILMMTLTFVGMSTGLLFLLRAHPTLAADTLFFDDFDDGYAGRHDRLQRYRRFLDDGDFNWYDVVQEAHDHIGSNCP